MDVHLRRRIGRQEDLVATWQLRREGWSRMMVGHWAEKEAWRSIHDGVWALGQAPLTQRQASREWREAFVSRSARCPFHDARRPDLHLGRGFREACRIGATTADSIARQLKGQRGTRPLGALCDRYATIPYHRCRSDAECRALEVLHDAGVVAPRVNIRVAGREADLVWRAWRLIVEVDSREFHPFPQDDADKQQRWEAAGYTVKRVMANDVYYRPHILLALVNGHMVAL